MEFIGGNLKFLNNKNLSAINYNYDTFKFSEFNLENSTFINNSVNQNGGALSINKCLKVNLINN